MSRGFMSRRALIADTAISTLARDGMRGLTHRAVDRAAGLPEGSASYHFRTRQAPGHDRHPLTDFSLPSDAAGSVRRCGRAAGARAG
jgi:hypothetical protein